MLQHCSDPLPVTVEPRQQILMLSSANTLVTWWLAGSFLITMTLLSGQQRQLRGEQRSKQQQRSSTLTLASGLLQSIALSSSGKHITCETRREIFGGCPQLEIRFPSHPATIWMTEGFLSSSCPSRSIGSSRSPASSIKTHSCTSVNGQKPVS